MNKLWASLRKEHLLLLSDKIGLLLIFILPVFLVFVITIVQDSAFRLVNENRMEVLFVNHDEGIMGDSLYSMLDRSGSFELEKAKHFNRGELALQTLTKQKLICIYVPSTFTKRIQKKSERVSGKILYEFGLTERKPSNKPLKGSAEIELIYDPVLQDNFRISIQYSLLSMVARLENNHLLRQLYADFGYEDIPDEIKTSIAGNQTTIKSQPAVRRAGTSLPNATQHNIPAWSVFAMFFMVVALGSSVVRERLSGSFVRLRTIPGAFLHTLISKVILYLLVALLQLILMFAIGLLIFPLIGLPVLNLPPLMPLFIFSLVAAMSAISFSLLVGTYAKTQEQANGTGAVLVIIFAAIGGIWVPTFVLPDYLQTIGMLSPLHWCIEGYYVLFLKNGAFADLLQPIMYLIIFILATQILTFIKLKKDNLI